MAFRRQLTCLVSLAVVLLATWPAGAVYAGSAWRQNTYEDFRQGVSDDGGVNLYAAADGTVRTIYTFDYNRDGANDILIISGHDNAYSPPTYIYLNDKSDGFDGRFRWLLLGNGAAGGAFADLDGNGYQDAILCGTSNGANFVALDAVVYFGSERGYATRASTRLPTYQSKSVAVIDCDGDGRLDLVFAQGQHPGLIIYYNSPDGFDPSRKGEMDLGAVSHTLVTDFNRDGRDDLTVLSGDQLLVYFANDQGIGNSADVTVKVNGAGGRYTVADLDGDGNLDVVVTNNKPTRLDITGATVDSSDAGTLIYFGDGRGGFTSRAPVALPGVSSRDVAVADFNRDGRPDIALANFGADNATGDVPTIIYWGSDEGYKPEHALRIETRFATSVKAADLDGDGWPDLAIACYRDDLSHNVDSYIYYNRNGTFTPENRVAVATLGAVNIAIGDADHDGRPDVMFLNVVDGTNGLTDSVIFWNDGAGRFGPERSSAIEGRDPFTHVAADLDLDGQLDLVLANSYEYARYREEGSYLYWGGDGREADWTPKRRILLPTDFATGVVAADFNKDGWLDLAFAQIGESVDERVEFQTTSKRSPVFWGSADGYSADRMTWLPVENPRGLTTGDLNRDGWLDLIYTNLTHETVPIFWGSADGFSADNRADLAVPGKGTVCVNSADINADGWLDLLFSCFYDYASQPLRSDRNSHLFLGSPEGFDPSRRVDFQTMAPTQTAIADFNKDGLLDIFFPNYANTYKNRTWSSYLYYNGPDGFAPGRRTSLFTHSGSYGLALDFNADGWLDLAVGSHMRGNGNHRSYSNLFHGGPDGFSDYNKTQYPTYGSHELTSVDPGHIYHRRFEIIYTSKVHDAGQTVTVGPVSWRAESPHGSLIRFQVRCADDRESLEGAQWTSVGGAESNGRPTGGTDAVLTGRFIQYRAVFVSKDGSNYPVLREVAIELE
jgi:FG-GAP-like repeat